MEKEANKAREELSQGSKSDLVALVNAYEGWKVGKASFAWQYYLSKETMDFRPTANQILFLLFLCLCWDSQCQDGL